VRGVEWEHEIETEGKKSDGRARSYKTARVRRGAFYGLGGAKDEKRRFPKAGGRFPVVISPGIK